MGWKKEVYVGTVSGGVYHTTNFAGPNGGQPIWNAVNEGLNELSLRQLFVDPFEPWRIQYCLSSGGFYRRINNGSWIQTLNSVETYNSLPDHSNEQDGAGTLLFFWPDRTIPGRIWIIFGPTSLYKGNGWAFRSNDYGLTWARMPAVAISGGNTYTTHNVIAQGNNIWIGYSKGAGAGSYVNYSQDAGNSWIVKNTGSMGEWGSVVYYHPDGLGVYTENGALGLAFYWLQNGVLTELAAGNSFGRCFLRVSSNDHNHQWLHKYSDHKLVFETTDNWQTFQFIGSLPNYCTQIALFNIDDGNGLVGTLINNSQGQSHCLGAYENNRPDLLVRLAGSSPGVAPYTNSIPYTAGDICSNGLQPVPVEPGHIYTHNVSFELGGK